MRKYIKKMLKYGYVCPRYQCSCPRQINRNTWRCIKCG